MRMKIPVETLEIVCDEAGTIVANILSITLEFMTRISSLTWTEDDPGREATIPAAPQAKAVCDVLGVSLERGVQRTLI